MVAEAAAAAAGASLYAVRQPPDLRWHIPSAEVSPEASSALAAFVAHVDVAVAIHGFGRVDHATTLLLGGRHRALAAHLAAHLRTALPGYRVVDDLDRIPRALRGVHAANPVNRPAGGGVQLELPPRVRGLGPFWEGHPRTRGGRPAPHTQALVAALASAARSWPPGDEDRL